MLGVAGVGCYALLGGWLRAKQADLPEMKKVQAVLLLCVRGSPFMTPQAA